MRVNTCAVVGIAVGFAASPFVPWQLAVLVGWCGQASLLLGWVWLEVTPLNDDATRARSTVEDNSRTAAAITSITASAISIGGVVVGLAKARHVHEPYEALLTVFSILTVLLSWSVVHTMYALRYAHLYYSDTPGGIDFHADPERPDYRDFLYLSFTIGMAFAVSDTDITSRKVRHTVTRHSVLSYFFGAAIIGLTINVMAGWVH
jgi:uncharacterized membrane protein